MSLHDHREGLSPFSLDVSMLTATHDAPGSRPLETTQANQGQPGGQSGHQFQPQVARDENIYY